MGDTEEEYQASLREFSSSKAAESKFSFKNFLPSSDNRPLLPISFQDANIFASKPDDWTETCGMTRFQVIIL